jgi:hypothetical protein
MHFQCTSLPRDAQIISYVDPNKFLRLLTNFMKIYRLNLTMYLSIGPNWVGFTWRRRQNPVSETLCFLNKNRTMDNVQKHNICTDLGRWFSAGAACVAISITYSISTRCHHMNAVHISRDKVYPAIKRQDIGTHEGLKGKFHACITLMLDRGELVNFALRQVYRGRMSSWYPLESRMGRFGRRGSETSLVLSVVQPVAVRVLSSELSFIILSLNGNWN